MLPRLSIVVAGSRPEGPPEALFGALHSHLQSGNVEVVIATARANAVSRWPGTRIVQCAPGATVPTMRLAGVRAANAPFIALTEDFCVPGDGWADTLMAASGRVKAAAFGGPVARRSGSAANWALTFVEYGRFFRREPEGEVSDLPSINVVYDARRLREALPPELQGLFEVQLHTQLRERGERFWRIPDAVMYDNNDCPFAKAARAQYFHGRLFGGDRVQGRSAFSRFLRCAIAPALPVILLGRIAREARAAGHQADLWRALPALLFLLVAWSLGEGVGSLLGKGQSAGRWT